MRPEVEGLVTATLQSRGIDPGSVCGQNGAAAGGSAGVKGGGKGMYGVVHTCRGGWLTPDVIARNKATGYNPMRGTRVLLVVLGIQGAVHLQHHLKRGQRAPENGRSLRTASCRKSGRGRDIRR